MTESAISYSPNTSSDSELEDFITATALLVCRIPDHVAKRHVAAAMTRLIALRSPEAVRRMEVEMGLR